MTIRVAAFAGVLACASLAGCAETAAERAATEQAWQQRDAERAAECAQKRGRWVAGGCVFGGGA